MPEIVDLTPKNVVAETLRETELDAALMNELLGDPQLSADLFAQFEKIEQLPANTVPGETLVRVGLYHIKLRKLILDTSVALVGIGIATIGTPLTLAIVGQKVLSIASSLHETLKGMSTVEVMVYDAIARIQRNSLGPGGNPKLDPNTPRGTEQDIINHFTARGEDPPLGLNNILDDLYQRKIIEKRYWNNKTIYLAMW